MDNIRPRMTLDTSSWISSCNPIFKIEVDGLEMTYILLLIATLEACQKCLKFSTDAQPVADVLSRSCF